MMLSSNMVYVTVMALWAVCCAAASFRPNISLFLDFLLQRLLLAEKFVQANNLSQPNQHLTLSLSLCDL